MQLLETRRAIRRMDDPMRVSVIDVVGAVTGYPQEQSSGMFRGLLDAYTELSAFSTYAKFPGRGQRETPVADTRTIALFIAMLPGKRASKFRKELLGIAPESAQELLDAEAILRERGCGQEQIARLAGELGKDLLLVARSEGQQPPTMDRQFGPELRQIRQYHRFADARLIDDVFQSFRERPLYKRVATEDPVTLQRQQLLAEQGRGRAKKQRTA